MVTAWGFCSLVCGQETLESKKIISPPLEQVRRKNQQRTVVALQLQTAAFSNIYMGEVSCCANFLILCS